MDRRDFNKLAGCAAAGALMDLREASRGWAAVGTTAKNSRRMWEHYMLGAAYYPEWWKASEWETDFRQMQGLGINTLRMGEFAWALFEPSSGSSSSHGWIGPLLWQPAWD